MVFLGMASSDVRKADSDLAGDEPRTLHDAKFSAALDDQYVLGQFVSHYEEGRPHQSLQQRVRRQRSPVPGERAGPVIRYDRLGGLLHEYMHQAADASRVFERHSFSRSANIVYACPLRRTSISPGLLQDRRADGGG